MSTFSNRTVAGSNPIEEWAQAWSLLILLKSRNQSSDDKYLPFHKIMFLYFYLKYVSIPLESFLYRLKTYQMKGEGVKKSNSRDRKKLYFLWTNKNIYFEWGEWKSWLKTQHSKNEDHGIWSHHFMANRWGNNGNSDRLFFWTPKITVSWQMVTAVMKLKDACSLEEKLRQLRQHIKKQRHYFANNGPSSQSYGFSSSHTYDVRVGP